MTHPAAAPGDFGASLALDVGTSAVKAAVLDANGHVLAQASRPLTTRTAPGGVMEQDAEDWWRAATEAVGALPAPPGSSLAAVRRLILTGQMQNLTLTDEAGRALRPTLLYGDQRALEESREALERLGRWEDGATAGRVGARGAADHAADGAVVGSAVVGAEIVDGDVAATEVEGGTARAALASLGDDLLRARTANQQDAGGLLAKLLWLRRHEPEVLVDARRIFFGAADLLAFRLTGKHACDTTTASTTGLMDFGARAYLPEALLEALGLGGVRSRLPRLVPGGEQVGVVLGAAGSAADPGSDPGPGRAQGLGSRPTSVWHQLGGLPVHLAPGDAGATTVGAGSGEPGSASGYIGSSGWVSFSAPGRGEPAAGVFTLAHPRPDRSIHVAPLLTAGGNLAWAAAALDAEAVPEGSSRYEAVIARALARPPARLLYLPYLRGERSPFRDPLARGAFIGLTPDTTRDDLLRAVLEGVALAYRHALEALVPGTATQLILTGGGTRSAGWCGLIATVLGRTVVVPDAPDAVGLRGALRCVQVAEGVAADYAITVVGRRFAPDETLGPAYDALFATFRSAHAELRPLFEGLAVAGSAASSRGPAR